MTKLVTVYLDGQYIKMHKDMLEAFTPGRMHAKGVFETLRIDDQQVVFLEEHLARLQMGMTFYQLALTLPKKKVLEIIRALLRQYPLRGHWRLRIMVWKEQHMVHHMLMILPYTPLKHEQYQQGIDVFVVPTEIKLSKRMANVKSLQYQLYDQAYQRAQINGASEALLLNKNNNVVEFSRGNIFYLLNHQWYTPPLSQGCLNGVVRQHVMRTVGPVVIKERPLAVKELTKVTGMLLTNSLIGSIPIRRILMG